MLSYVWQGSKEAAMAESYTVRYETQIPAPRATVFAFLLDPDKLVRWIGQGAEMDPQPGGLYMLKNISGQHSARGSFKEVVPVHRLAYTFGWEDRADDVPPGSSLVEIDLEEKDGGTLLKLTHSGLPSEQSRADHAKGWAHYFERLGTVAPGGKVEADKPW
jgi:uncharacterized protein YndB with AHSA1/START domain